MSVSIIIVIATVLISIVAFQNSKLMGDLIFDPIRVTNNKQYYRFITSGFVHADFTHLAFNMFSLYMFGPFVEAGFANLFGSNGSLMFALMYILALIVSLIPTYNANKHNAHYLGLGASGAVSAVVFAGLLLAPTITVGFYFIPPIIPGFIFGPLYLAFSYYLEKRGGGNVNHSAHIWGALFGLAFVIFTGYTIAHEPVVQDCLTEIKRWLFQHGIG